MIIGFIEGEGTFGIKTGSSLYFQVAQKNTSQECLNGITNFLLDLSSNAAIHKDAYNKILPINVTNTINIRTNVVSLAIANIDALYYYLLPYLDSSKFYSRKAIDFKLWIMALLLKIYGYYYTIEGKNLFLDISEIINKRYSTNSSLGLKSSSNTCNRYIDTNRLYKNKDIFTSKPVDRASRD